MGQSVVHRAASIYFVHFMHFHLEQLFLVVLLNIQSPAVFFVILAIWSGNRLTPGVPGEYN